MQRAEVWPLELVPSPLAGQHFTPSASISTSFYFSSSPLNADYSSAAQVSADYNKKAIDDVSQLLVRSQPDMYVNSVRETRGFTLPLGH